PELITVGHNCRINEGVLVVGSGPLILGNHVHIGGQVILATSGLDYKKEGWPHFSAQIELKDYVWVGAGARIRPGVTVGEGAIIGMGSVVTHDVLPYTVVAGSPARCISLVEHHLQCTCKQ
ncbi:MAG: acyltransferase, partial [Candidatus Pacebacteria bacterium]|nr:acyltransferase [Candidatus Paceibacterota bacterium]